MPKRNPALAAEWEQAKHANDAELEFVPGLRPLPAHRGRRRQHLRPVRGDVPEPALQERAVGFIVPTGIATDNSTKAFFDEVTSRRRLVSLLDFENREGVFPGVHRSYKFCLLTLGSGVPATIFTFFATRTEHLADERRRFRLSPEEIALINPNTKTCPVFRSQADTELSKKIYRRVPVLIDETKGETGNVWEIELSRMLHMGEDSALFRTRAQLQAAGGRLTA